MAISLYDDAILQKFKNWTQSTNLHIYGPNDTAELFEVIADTTNDQPIKLPILAIRRNTGYNILNTNKRTLTYDGMMLDSTCKRSLSLNAIPIEIFYQVDIYTRFFKEADEYMRNIIFNVINFPTLQIFLPYLQQNIVHNSTIRISDASVQDNSDISERLISGQFTRLSLILNIDDAYLWDVRMRDNVYIDTDVRID